MSSLLLHQPAEQNNSSSAVQLETNLDVITPFDQNTAIKLIESTKPACRAPSNRSITVVPLQTHLSIKTTESSKVTHREDEGVFMTREDLWVTVLSGRNRKPILQGLTGYAKPGKLLAIMGPSGCGKTTLLDDLAGRLGSNTKQTGEILINGHKQALAYGTSAYVTQDDAMLSTLTAGEALYYSCQLQLPDSMSIEQKERADFTLREMGLQDATHTRIGGQISKGLSSGQKRRLSICVEILTRPRLLFLDEPTSGLDSAASYYVMSRIASPNLKDGIQRTIVASIRQPSSEFFASNGFPCPSLYNPSDHFLRIINKDFEPDAEEGFGEGVTTEEAINILLKSYTSSEIHKEIQRAVKEIRESDSDAIEQKRIHAGFFTQCLILIRRSSLHMFRNMSNYWLRLAVYSAIAVCLGTMFCDIGSSVESIQARGSLLTFLTSFFAFMTLVDGLPPLLKEMTVFKRERLNGHYGVTAFLIGNTVSAVPYMLLISVVPGAMVHYLSGLHKGLEHLLYLISVLFATVMTVESLMMVVGSVFPNFIMGMIIVGGIQGVMILTSGFCRPPNLLPKPVWRYPLEHLLYLISVLFATVMTVESLMMVVGSVFPNFIMGMIIVGGIQGVMILTSGFCRPPNLLPKPVWRYPLFYVSFHKYALQGLFKNEFEGLTFGSDEDGYSESISGREILRNIWQVEMGYSKWVDLAILLGIIVLYRLLFFAITKSMEKA